MKSFREYIESRGPILSEMDGKAGDKMKVASQFSLGKENDFAPFVVTDDPRNKEYPSNKNLAPVIRAFADSNKVSVYNSLDKQGKNKPHNLPAKKLYMVGGPVRDHISGKTPKDIDLATEATPDEIRMILTAAGFREINTPDTQKGPRSGEKVFYVKGKDKRDREFVFGVKVGGQEFDLATFRKDGKTSADGRHPDEMEYSSQRDDADRRDLTINSMYLLLNNPDGPNSQVTDFHGGAHDLASGNVRFVGNPEDRLDEDLLRALRYVRFAAKYGKGKAAEEIKQAIRKVAPQIRKSVSPERIQEEFSKGLAYKEVNPELYIKLYKDLGLLDVVFPGMKFKLETPEDYPSDRDPSVVIATLLRNNDPEAVQKTLEEGRWSNQEIRRITFLQKILNLNPKIEPAELDKLLRQYQQSGVMDQSLSSWWSSNNRPKEILGAFLDYAKSPRVKLTNIDPETGEENVHPDFADIIDPYTKKPYSGNHTSGIPFGHLAGSRKRDLEHRNFQNFLSGKI